jgi:cation transport protein ChaC
MTRLTRELVQAVHPGPVDDQGEAVELATPQELAESLRACQRSRPAGGPVWVFAYGSLMWKPEVPVVEKRRAMLHGWHRRFCLWQWRHRATRERPNLMLGLDRGGCCQGMVLRLPARGVASLLERLWQREMIGRGYHARWVRAATPAGPVTALAFVVRREGLRYAGRLPDEQVAACRRWWRPGCAGCARSETRRWRQPRPAGARVDRAGESGRTLARGA